MGLKKEELRWARPWDLLVGQRVGVYEVITNTDVLTKAGCCFPGFRSWKRRPGCVIGSVVIGEPLPPTSRVQELASSRDKHGVEDVGALLQGTRKIVAWQLTEPREWADADILPRGWGRMTGQGALRKFEKRSN
jgi:hypothetical protein